MVVVPAFAQREERKKPVVLARVGRLVANRAEEVRKRVDRKRIVPEQNRTQDKSPEKQRQATDEIKRDSKRRRRHPVIFVEPAQFRKLRKVRDVVRARVVIAVRNDPPYVRPEKPKQRRRVQIL